MRVANKRTPIYCRALVITHGASEYQIASYIKRHLRLPLEISSKDNGKHSIQINSLSDWLIKQFPTQDKFVNQYYNVQYDGESLVDFVVFPIMDTDDCDPESLFDKYKDKSLFTKHWLKPYIQPIFNTPSLDHILLNAGIIDHLPPKNKKMEVYSKIFPLKTNKTFDSNLDEIIEFRNRLTKVGNTNFTEFIDYCINWAKANRV